MTEKVGVSQAEFDLRISRATEPVRKKYIDLLNKRRGELIDSKQLPDIGLEEREHIFDRALQVGQYGSADSKKMAKEVDRRELGVNGGAGND